MKNPSPSMARLLVTPVTSREPSLKLRETPPATVPMPTCRGLVPPRSLSGAEPKEKVWENCDLKSRREDLKPTVLTLAMLLPTTSSLDWLVERPERPVWREDVMP